MASERKFRANPPKALIWGAVACLLGLGMLTTIFDLAGLSKRETLRANHQQQRFVVNAASGEVSMGDGSSTPEAKPAVVEPPKTETPPEPAPAEVSPAEEKPAEPVATPAPAPTAETPAEKPVEAVAPAKEAAAPAAASAPTTAPEKPATASATPAATSPAPAASAAPAVDPALPKNTPSLRTTPLAEALQDQPRTKDSLVMAPAPEITETVDGIKIPKRGDKNVTPAHLYAHPFKRQPDQVLLSFVILNTGLDPQSIGLAMALPPEVTIAYSPYTKPGMAYSENVRAVGHEVWTMLPAMGEHYPSDDPGPMGIIAKMPPEETTRRVREVMGAIPGAVGLILPPDETIIQQKGTMDAAIGEISARGLLLMTTNPNHNTDQISTNAGLAAIIRRADLVLDPTPNESQIRSKLSGLLDAAKDKGEYVVVLSARPQSLQIVNDWLQQTKLGEPFVLAPLSAIYEPKEAPEVKAPEGGAAQKEKPKAKPAKPKPKVLPQDQYEPKAAPGADKDKKPEEKK